MKIGFIGFGNMASAIADGMLRGGIVPANDIVAYNPHREKIDAFGRGIAAAETAAQAAAQAKYLFLCVKPQMLDEAVPSFRDALRPDAVIVSILAGKTAAQIKESLRTDRPVVRVMPNTPLMLGKGCSALARPADVSVEDFDFIRRVFSASGYAFETTESLINEIIPVNGSSPAAIYYFAKLFADSARKMGVDFDLALRAFAYTLIGSAAMILDSGKDIDTLIQMVCSKGGTTLAMLDALDANGFPDAVEKGIDACVRRAYELGDKK
ncbi:MAG: pyrroline-5-carboxylate reductase [Oscillospiraceae bacterium]|nr:pyrroline-5-carboxylate reductase [Oscillospiraceae bacterium]